MHFQKLPKIVVLTTIFIPLLLLSQEQNSVNEKILSNDRLKLFEYSEEQNEQSSSKLRKDWINPITLSYEKSKSDTNDTLRSAINISQPIFKSGGIYSAIKYANATFDYTKFDIELQRKELIKEATTMLFNLHIVDLNIKRNELLLKNAQIDVNNKKEQVMNGFIDTSTLDNAILDANEIKNKLADLYYDKDELIRNFGNLASGEYTSFDLPKLSLVDEKSFLKRNLELSKAKASVDQKDYFSDMTVAKYLPTVSLDASHSQYHEDKKK